MRDTWYTPPREKTFQIPVHMFTLSLPPSFDKPNDEHSNEETTIGGLPVTFGWIRYDENNFFKRKFYRNSL